VIKNPENGKISAFGVFCVKGIAYAIISLDSLNMANGKLAIKSERRRNNMTCIFCGGNMSDEFTTDFTDLGTCMVVIKKVPCITCEQCGETVFIGTVVRQLEQITNALKDSLTEVAIVQYANTAA